MRILLVHGYGLEGSGSSIYTRNLARALLRQGHSVCLAAFRHRGDERAFDKLVAQGMDFRPLPRGQLTVAYPRKELPNAPIAAQLSPQQQRATADALNVHLVDIIREVEPDLVLANHFLLVGDAATRAAKTFAIPSAIVSHGTDIEYGANRSASLREIARQTFNRATHRVALSPTSRQRAAHVLGVSETEFKTISSGIDGNLFHYKDGERSRRIAHVGRFVADKGPHLTLAAAIRVLDKWPDAEFVFLGDGTHFGNVVDLVHALDECEFGQAQRLLSRVLKDSDHHSSSYAVYQELFGQEGRNRLRRLKGSILDAVQFAGYVGAGDLAKILQQTRVVVLPSLIPECFPLALLEAVATGNLVVASPSGGTKDILQWASGVAPQIGSICSIDLREPVRSLASQIEDALSTWSEPLAQELAASAVARFGWNRVAQNLLHVETSNRMPSVARWQNQVA